MRSAAISARPFAPGGGRVRRVRNRDILPSVLRAAAARAAADPRTRSRLLKEMWIALKRTAAPRVVNVDLASIAGLEGVRVEGHVMRHSPLVLCALASLLECEAIFEFGTYRGDTAWLLAHNLRRTRVHTLDLPGLDAVRDARLEVTDVGEYFGSWDRGARFRGTPEAERITPLAGDSATFDFSPFRGRMDLVYIDASHSYSYVRSDSEAALEMLGPRGTIVWDDYTHYPGLYAYLNELAPSLERPIYHLLGTRLAVYSRRDLLAPEARPA
jgi:predicted O-methyltransferase YrrM